MDFSQFELAGKTALVTGGNTGIGLGIAKGLARAGARVAICGRGEEKNKEALETLDAVGEGSRSFVFDLEYTQEIEGFFNKVSETMDGIDILVNNAGMQCRGRADEIAISDFEKVLRVNLTAPYVLPQCFARSN